MKPAPSSRCWAEIDSGALRHNFRLLRSLAPPPQHRVIAVVKADAYGHGVSGVAPVLARAGVAVLAVANLTEAGAASRFAPRTDVLILGPMLPWEMEEAVRHPRWMFTISSKAEAQHLARAARRVGRVARIHLKVDTGMGRVGSFPEEALALLQQLRHHRALRIEGLFSHLATAEEDLAEARRQREALHRVVEETRATGLTIPHVHLQNSAGAIRLSVVPWLDMIRCGLSLYGVGCPAAAWKQRFGSRGLRPVLAWKTRVVLVRDVPSGTPISYGQTFRARRKMKLAVLAAGYADGISRKLSNRGAVLIRGHRCPIVGRVTMDMIVVDAGRATGVRPGDEAVLIGRSGRERLTAEEVAAWAETIPYDTLCRISARVPRVTAGAH